MLTRPFKAEKIQITKDEEEQEKLAARQTRKQKDAEIWIKKMETSKPEVKKKQHSSTSTVSVSKPGHNFATCVKATEKKVPVIASSKNLSTYTESAKISRIPIRRPGPKKG
jgi:hypothetical protein